MRFSANVSILFKEVPLLERFGSARAAGFSAVEFWWPSGEDLGEIEAAIEEAELAVALFNFDAGDMPNGDRGLISDPDRQEQFMENVPAALELARRLGCWRLNVLAGHKKEGIVREEQLDLARQNVAFGDVASVIQEAAEEGEEPTLVVVGRRGLGTVTRFALDSVSSAVLRSVSGPVLIVPSPREVT